MTATKTGYREWIKRRYGSIHQEQTEEKYATKRWKITQNNIRDTFIDEYADSGYKPAYMVTRTYYYEQNNIKKVKEDNKRILPRNSKKHHKSMSKKMKKQWSLILSLKTK